MEGNSCRHSPLQFRDTDFEFAAEPFMPSVTVEDDSDEEGVPEEMDLNELVAHSIFSTQTSPLP